MRFDTQRAGARLSELVGRRLGLTAVQAAAAGQVALLRDVGLISVPEWILEKPGPLTNEERAIVHRHPLVGARIGARSPGSPISSRGSAPATSAGTAGAIRMRSRATTSR